MNEYIFRRRVSNLMWLMSVPLTASLLLFVYNRDRAGGGDAGSFSDTIPFVLAGASVAVWLVLGLLRRHSGRLVEFLNRHGARVMTGRDEAVVREKVSMGRPSLSSVLIFSSLLLVIVGSGAGLWLARDKAVSVFKLVEFGSVEELELVLRAHPGKLRERNDRGQSLLDAAVAVSRREMVELLLELDAPVNQLDPLRQTPVIKAVDQPWLLELLLRGDANVNYRDEYGFTPLHWALKKRCVESVRMLVEHGARLNIRSGDYQTPLIMAINEDIDVVDLLVCKGANLQMADLAGNTPLHCAVLKGNDRVVELLLNAGANQTLRSKKDLTPLHLAALNGRHAAARYLLGHGIFIDIANRREITPLRCAVQRGDLEMVRLLLEHGADVNLQDRLGNTCLHDALADKHAEIAVLLRDHGARDDIRNKVGLTPRDMADPAALGI